MIVSINQPAYLPWAGWFDRIKRSDYFISLDNVQLEKGGYTNRNRIRLPDGRIVWLTIPVEKSKPIRDTRITDQYWRRKHRETLNQAYGERDWWFLEADTLTGVCFQSAVFASRQLPFPIRTKGQDASSLNVRGAKSDLILNICKEVWATQYISGPGGRDYLDLPAFDRAGIEVLFHDVDPPADGSPHLSVLDYLYGDTPWPQAHLTSAHSLPPLAAQVAAPALPLGRQDPVPPPTHPPVGETRSPH